MKKRLAIAITMALMAVMALSSTVFAGVNIPVDIDIPITYIVHGNDRVAGGDTFILTPDDPEAPMPEDAVDGEASIKITREGNYSFGTIHYDRPEVWWYTVSRDVTKKKGVMKDNTVFRVKVIALYDGHGYINVFAKGSDKKCELVYIDKVSPKTGDNNTLIYAGTAFAALAVILGFVAIKKRGNKKE